MTCFLIRGVLFLHGDEGGEVRRVVGQHEGRAMARLGVALDGQVDTAEGYGCEGLALGVLQHGVGHHYDGAPQHVGQDEHVELLQALVEHLVILLLTLLLLIQRLRKCTVTNSDSSISNDKLRIDNLILTHYKKC